MQEIKDIQFSTRDYIYIGIISILFALCLMCFIQYLQIKFGKKSESEEEVDHDQQKLRYQQSFYIVPYPKPRVNPHISDPPEVQLIKKYGSNQSLKTLQTKSTVEEDHSQSNTI